VTRRILALLAALALLLGGPLAAPATADFHVLRSVPAAGATVVGSPAEVQVTLDQPVNDVASTVQVTSGSDVYNSGVLRVDNGATLAQPVRRMGAGDYQVTWTASAGAGQPATSGSFHFTVTSPPEPSAGIGQWLVIALMALVVALLGTTLARRRLARRAAEQKPARRPV
jgi:methionine-rich copper-binding protein CopC